MAIEREIPKDITKYKSKLVGPFTTRQIICFAPAAAIIGLVVFLVKKYGLATDTGVTVGLLISTPFLLCGIVAPYGIPFEKFVTDVLLRSILAPSKRKYETKNMLEPPPDPQKKKINPKKYTPSTSSNSAVFYIK